MAHALRCTLWQALAAWLGLAAGGQSPEPRYDPLAGVDFSAAVIEVREIPLSSALNGIHLVVKADNSTLDVYAGPTEFVKSFEVIFARGDRVHVAGSRVKFGDGYVVLAREIRKDEITLYLRDRKGEPNWSVKRGKT